jgi:hypothetical protein
MLKFIMIGTIGTRANANCIENSTPVDEEVWHVAVSTKDK